MFERLEKRGERLARVRSEAVRDALASELAASAPPGVAVRAGADGVELSGRGLLRRAALDPALRGLLGRMR